MAKGTDKKRELARFAGEVEKNRQKTVELSFLCFSFSHGVTADSSYDDVGEAGFSERKSIRGKERKRKRQRKRTVYKKAKQNKTTSQWRKRTSGSGLEEQEKMR